MSNFVANNKSKWVDYEDHLARIKELESQLAEANDYINKINSLYQDEKIFYVRNGEAFYTDEFDAVIMTNIVYKENQQ